MRRPTRLAAALVALLPALATCCTDSPLQGPSSCLEQAVRQARLLSRCDCSRAVPPLTSPPKPPHEGLGQVRRAVDAGSLRPLVRALR